MGIASGVVAALVATVFLVLVTAVNDQQDATAAAQRAQQVIFAATAVRLHPSEAGVEALAVTVRGNAVQAERVARIGADPSAPGAQQLLDAIITSEQAKAENRSDFAESKADLATA